VRRHRPADVAANGRHHSGKRKEAYSVPGRLIPHTMVFRASSPTLKRSMEFWRAHRAQRDRQYGKTPRSAQERNGGDEIKGAIVTAKGAFLLVSPHSDFIAEHERHRFWAQQKWSAH
jgi:hypothetical protein